MIVVPVALGDRSYDVHVGAGARRELGRVILESVPFAIRASIVTQRSIADAGWLDGLDPGVPFLAHFLPDGEDAKSLECVETLCRELVGWGLTRSDVIVALGGGTVSDVVGFAAATYHRGVAYVNVPTSLLGQVDAAIGGKTGVNLPEGKNLVGAFWQPSAVFCDTDCLDTLPPREWACGRGEMAKYALLDGGEPDVSILTLPLEEQVARCVAIKAAVVEADERESGRRAILNYGHTLAHALEAQALGGVAGAEAGSDLRHGEAVAIGLVFAALLAKRLGRIDETRLEAHRRIVKGFDLHADLPSGIDHAKLLEAMERDKKVRLGLSFVLDGPNGIEQVDGIDPDDVLATLAEMGKGTPGRDDER